MNGAEAAGLLAIALLAIVGWHVNRAKALSKSDEPEPIERDWQWPSRKENR
jgi:hypothetical protein